MSSARGGSPKSGKVMFYRLDLFEDGALSAIEYFDPHELAEAKERAVAAVNDGAERAEVHNDADEVVFHVNEECRRDGYC